MLGCWRREASVSIQVGGGGKVYRREYERMWCELKKVRVIGFLRDFRYCTGLRMSTCANDLKFMLSATSDATTTMADRRLTPKHGSGVRQRHALTRNMIARS